MCFLPLLNFTIFLLPNTVTQLDTHCQWLSSSQCASVIPNGLPLSGVCKTVKCAENVQVSLPALYSFSTSLQATCSHWGAAWKEERFCKTDAENKPGKQRKTVNWKMLQYDSQARWGKWYPEWFGMTRFWASGVERIFVKSEWKTVSGMHRKRK